MIMHHARIELASDGFRDRRPSNEHVVRWLDCLVRALEVY